MMIVRIIVLIIFALMTAMNIPAMMFIAVEIVVTPIMMIVFIVIIVIQNPDDSQKWL